MFPEDQDRVEIILENTELATTRRADVVERAEVERTDVGLGEVRRN